MATEEDDLDDSLDDDDEDLELDAELDDDLDDPLVVGEDDDVVDDDVDDDDDDDDDDDAAVVDDDDDAVADEEEDEEDEEESLEVLLGPDAADGEVRVEDARAGLAAKAPATVGEGEFTCRSCFLVKRRAQLADEDALICLDCD